MKLKKKKKIIIIQIGLVIFTILYVDFLDL